MKIIGGSAIPNARLYCSRLPWKILISLRSFVALHFIYSHPESAPFTRRVACHWRLSTNITEERSARDEKWKNFSLRFSLGWSSMFSIAFSRSITEIHCFQLSIKLMTWSLRKIILSRLDTLRPFLAITNPQVKFFHFVYCLIPSIPVPSYGNSWIYPWRILKLTWSNSGDIFTLVSKIREPEKW